MKYITSFNLSSMPNYLKIFKVKWKGYYKWAMADYRWLLMFCLSRFKFIKNLSAYFSHQPH